MEFILTKHHNGLAAGIVITLALLVRPLDEADELAVLQRLVDGSLEPHCRPVVPDGRDHEVLLEAHHACTCFGAPATRGQALVGITIQGRQSAEDKLAIAEDLRRGRFAGHLVTGHAAKAQLAAEANTAEALRAELIETLRARLAELNEHDAELNEDQEVERDHLVNRLHDLGVTFDPEGGEGDNQDPSKAETTTTTNPAASGADEEVAVVDDLDDDSDSGPALG